MIQVFKDTFKISLFMGIIFLLAMIASAYVLYSLPEDLMLPHHSRQVLSKTYVILGGTLILGALTIYLALKTQREVIVYKEKINETEKEEAENSTFKQSQNTISMDSVKGSLKDEEKVMLQNFINALCKQLDAGQGAIYRSLEEDGIHKIQLKCGYALAVSENSSVRFDFGEGLVGQAAAEGRTLYVDEVPEGYIKVISGLGSASPRYLLIMPIKKGDKAEGVIEIASFGPFTNDQRKFVEDSIQLLANKLSTT